MNAKERVEQEAKDLNYKLNKLQEFFDKDNFKLLEGKSQQLLQNQKYYMEKYYQILQMRLTNWQD